MQTDTFVKQRILTAITKHPKVVMFGIGLAVAAAITVVLGTLVLVPQQVYAPMGSCSGCYVQ